MLEILSMGWDADRNTAARQIEIPWPSGLSRSLMEPTSARIRAVEAVGLPGRLISRGRSARGGGGLRKEKNELVAGAGVGWAFSTFWRAISRRRSMGAVTARSGSIALVVMFSFLTAFDHAKRHSEERGATASCSVQARCIQNVSSVSLTSRERPPGITRHDLQDL